MYYAWDNHVQTLKFTLAIKQPIKTKQYNKMLNAKYTRLALYENKWLPHIVKLISNTLTNKCIGL